MPHRPGQDDFSHKENLICFALAVAFIIAFVSWLIISYNCVPINQEDNTVLLYKTYLGDDGDKPPDPK